MHSVLCGILIDASSLRSFAYLSGCSVWGSPQGPSIPKFSLLQQPSASMTLALRRQHDDSTTTVTRGQEAVGSGSGISRWNPSIADHCLRNCRKRLSPIPFRTSPDPEQPQRYQPDTPTVLPVAFLKHVASINEHAAFPYHHARHTMKD